MAKKIDPVLIQMVAEYIYDDLKRDYDAYHIIRGATQDWGFGFKEPERGGTFFLNKVLQGSLNRDNPYGDNNRFARAWARRLVSAALRLLLKKGKIESSLGRGRSGREERQYNPKY